MVYEVSCENKNESLTLPVDAKLLSQLARAEYFNQLRVICEEIGLVVTGDKDKFVLDVLSALVVGTELPKKEDIAKDKEDDFTVPPIRKSWAVPSHKQYIGHIQRTAPNIQQVISNMQEIPRNTDT